MLLCFPRMKIVGLVSPEPCLLVRLISCDLFAPGNLKSGTFNFWKMEGAQKVTFSIQNLYSQMHFRSQMCPGGHLEGFEACLKRRSELRTRARNSFVFRRKIKDLHDNLDKIIGGDPAAPQKSQRNSTQEQLAASSCLVATSTC